MNELDFHVGIIRTIEPAEKILSKDTIEKMITSIEALEIEHIGSKICKKILDGLHPNRMVEIQQQVMSKKGSTADNSMRLIFNTKMHAKLFEKGKIQFLTDSEAKEFLKCIFLPITITLTQAFTTPSQFSLAGVYFPLSEHEPLGVLKDTLKQDLKVPFKYSFHLELDKKLTEKRSELVFNLIEVSDSVEISKETFTIKELQQSLLE